MLENLMAARLQMAVSLGFHIIFACIGMVMPFLMAFAHLKWLRKKEQVYMDITKSWSKGVAIFFATGAVSGTVLSFELGLLWPDFMLHAGPVIGMPFSWEGTAFFLEAIALGLFLYGWARLNKWVHWGAGVVVGISGLASGIFVLAANSWMNAPAGFDWVEGKAVNIDPFAAMFNEAWAGMAAHMVIAAFAATSFAVAGIHGLLLLKNRDNLFHRKAMTVALWFGAIAAIVQPLSGDLLAKEVAERQPAKLAAMEALFETEKGASLVIGGIPNAEERRVDYAIKIPKMLSYLAHGDFEATVMGLDQIPVEMWPPVLVTHIAFQIMVAAGMILISLSVVFLIMVAKNKLWLRKRWFLMLTVIATPLGFIAVEAGWTVTEVGRQPWIIYGVMLTRDAVTPMPGIEYSFYLYTGIYLILALLVTWLMVRHISVLPKLYPQYYSQNGK